MLNSFKDLKQRLLGKGLWTRSRGEEWSRRECWRTHLNKAWLLLVERTEDYQSVPVVFTFKSYANKISHRKLESYYFLSSSSKSDNSVLMTPKHGFLLTDT